MSVPILQARRRSNSLPIPQIEISVYQGTNSNSRDSPSANTLKDFIEVPEQVMTNVLGGDSVSDSSDSKVQHHTEKVTGTIERRANSERKRNVKIASFKSLIESKIFSKSEKELERIGLSKKHSATDTTSCISQDEMDPVNMSIFLMSNCLFGQYFCRNNCWVTLCNMTKRYYPVPLR